VGGRGLKAITDHRLEWGWENITLGKEHVMDRFRRRTAALRRATNVLMRAHVCEPLEQRTLLSTTDPVIVLTERL
jgi:hypothetical protein